MTISVLARNGQSGRAIARMLGVAENTVRYHLQRTFRRHFPRPALRARRRVETPPGW